MTFVDNTQTSSRSLGNWNRMIQAADYVASGQRGVDFIEVISAANPWSVTTAASISISSNAREHPV